MNAPSGIDAWFMHTHIGIPIAGFLAMLYDRGRQMKGECGKPHPLPTPVGVRLIHIYSINPHFKIPDYTNAIYVYELRLFTDTTNDTSRTFDLVWSLHDKDLMEMYINISVLHIINRLQ